LLLRTGRPDRGQEASLRRRPRRTRASPVRVPGLSLLAPGPGQENGTEGSIHDETERKERGPDGANGCGPRAGAGRMRGGNLGRGPRRRGRQSRRPEAGLLAHMDNYAGKVEGTEVFVAVVDKEDRALAYLCDGRMDRPPHWPSGSPGPWQTTAPSTSRAREERASRRRSA
jgi:hypothetical protein